MDICGVPAQTTELIEDKESAAAEPEAAHPSRKTKSRRFTTNPKHTSEYLI
jgi:hypothetical protein